MDAMEDESSQADANASTFTPADRIAELNAIDKVRIPMPRLQLLSLTKL